jgi:8-oxo-dGTP pyrophosphatase MutT (NUDIX family)
VETHRGVEAVPAASVLVLRDDPLRVLMMRRPEDASFVPDAWVFPGGMVEPGDGDLARELGDGSTLGAMRVAAARELFEETGLWLGAPLEHAEQKRRRLLAGSLTFRQLLSEAPLDFSRLVWTSHWITPVGIPKRFDTYFFLVEAPPDALATIESEEAVEIAWPTPAEALGNLKMVFPTIKNLESLAAFDSAREAIDARHGAAITPVQPVLVDGKPRLP